MRSDSALRSGNGGMKDGVAVALNTHVRSLGMLLDPALLLDVQMAAPNFSRVQIIKLTQRGILAKGEAID